MSKRNTPDQAICNHARILIAGGANNELAAEMLGIGKSTVQKIRQAGFDVEKYRQLKQQEKERVAEKAAKQPEGKEPKEWKRWTPPAECVAPEEQVQGQLQMELPEKEPEGQAKQFRFQAAMMDRIITELDRINDTLSQLVRAIRKE